jgi:signal transduction histidine kinase
MSRNRVVTFWRYLQPILPPVLLCALVVLVLLAPVRWWLYGEEKFDQEALREWIREARINETLPDLVTDYITQVELANRWQEQGPPPGHDLREVERQRDLKHEEVGQYLKALADPPTKMYRSQLPLFPLIFRLSVHFDDGLKVAPIFWDSGLPRQTNQFRVMEGIPIHDRAHVNIHYHLHAYSQRQLNERQEATRRLWLSGLGLFFAVLAFVWIYIAQRRERERQRQRGLAEQERTTAERLRLEEELRRQEAERRHEEAERQNLELKSQLFANIGIMAGSYAHNIKNLLVRPNDLLRRCLEESSVSGTQADMLHEVRQTLGTVTERLQQILQTVRRDPSRSERVRIDVNALAADMHRTWADLAREKWKLNLELDLQTDEATGAPVQLWIEGDLSHLQQAVENLLFNARDATFEMRNHLREAARQRRAELVPLRAVPQISDVSETSEILADAERRHALIAAAAWKGQVVLRTRRHADRAILEVQDNGIGMSEEVRRRCTETHFSTKRDNALFAGLSAGMGLGLSFVIVILEHHQAKLEIESAPLKGTVFRVSLPLLGVQ